jgi:hypothetical protein
MYQTFIDCSTHLGNSLTSTGNADLSNKMVSHMSDQKLFLIKTFYAFGASHVAMVRQYHWEFYVCVVASRDILFCRIVKLKRTWSVCEKCVQTHKRITSVCIAQKATTGSPRQNAQCLAQQIWVSNSNAWKICCDDLLLFLYRMQIHQPLLEDILLWASTECYRRTIQLSWISYTSLMKHTSTWMVTLTSKMCDFRPHPRLTVTNAMHPERVMWNMF